ncbi:MAG: hypothetical protein ABIH23_09100 [bacterium]
MPLDHHTAANDPILSALDKAQVHFADFQKLTGVDDVRELTFNRIRKTRERIAREDRTVRFNNSGNGVTCLPWTVGAFWLRHEGLLEYFKVVQRVNATQGNSGVQPAWQLTVREVVNQHIGNLRQLVLSLAYDWVIIEAFSGKLLSHDHVALNKELTRCEQVVQDLIQKLLVERESIGSLLGVNVELYERAHITERMIHNGDIDETALGSTLEKLRLAQERARELCRQELAVFEQLLEATRGNVEEGLREGERAQFARVNRLDYTFQRIEEIPDGFVGLASLVAFDRRRLAAVVASREEELGPSKEGEALLAQSKVLDQTGDAPRVKTEAPPAPSEGRILRRVDENNSF